MFKVFIIWVCGGDVETRRVNTEDEVRADGAYSARYGRPLPSEELLLQ